MIGVCIQLASEQGKDVFIHLYIPKQFKKSVNGGSLKSNYCRGIWRGSHRKVHIQQLFYPMIRIR